MEVYLILFLNFTTDGMLLLGISHALFKFIGFSEVRTVERIYSNLCKTVDPSHSSSLSYLFNKGKLKLSGPKCQK